MNLEFAADTANLGLCGGANYCPDGDFCGKQIRNPEYGITNFDNILYSFLNVFISVTMEGWSEFMTRL